ncbi:hypothetical protein ACOMHN_023927 [Nucella lapillus]
MFLSSLHTRPLVISPGKLSVEDVTTSKMIQADVGVLCVSGRGRTKKREVYNHLQFDRASTGDHNPLYITCLDDRRHDPHRCPELRVDPSCSLKDQLEGWPMVAVCFGACSGR